MLVIQLCPGGRVPPDSRGKVAAVQAPEHLIAVTGLHNWGHIQRRQYRLLEGVISGEDSRFVVDEHDRVDRGMIGEDGHNVFIAFDRGVEIAGDVNHVVVCAGFDSH